MVIKIRGDGLFQSGAVLQDCGFQDGGLKDAFYKIFLNYSVHHVFLYPMPYL